MTESYHNPLAGQPQHAPGTEPAPHLVGDAETVATASPSEPDTSDAWLPPVIPEVVSVARQAVLAGILAGSVPGEVEHLSDTTGPDAAWDVLRSCLSVAGAATRALDAIAPLFAPGDVIELRALNPAGGGGLSFCGRLDVPEERAALVDFIDTQNGRWNLYFGANPRIAKLAGTGAAASAAQIAARRSIFLDLDDKDAPANDRRWMRMLDVLRKPKTRPAMIVHTGNGWHVWWRVQEVSGDALAASKVPLAGLMARYGSDNVADLPRVARLPFTVNLPNATKRGRGMVPAFATLRVARHGSTGKGGEAWSLDVAVERLGEVATSFALLGKRGAVASGPSVRTKGGGGAGGDRTPWPAPSADVLRLALSELPNGDDGAFAARADWVELCAAVKGAATAAKIEHEGREAFLNWCDQWGGDPAKNARVWDTCEPRTGWGSVLRVLEDVNPDGYTRVVAAVNA
jgi:hypothetical protein